MCKPGTHTRPISIWAFTDNKPGHRNQMEGLIAALKERGPLNCFWKPLDGPCHTFLATLKDCYRAQPPDFIIGAGHRTHIFLLLTRLLTGAKTIVLMKPSLPLNWFDLVLIPAHDGNFHDSHIITTQGVINKIKPSRHHDMAKGLFLIGGPSKHHGWDSANLALQIQTIAAENPDVHWQLTTSRRTPADFIEHLDHVRDNLKLIPHSETDADWLPRQLADSGQVWVTEDSVSMLYEALTSGANTGLLEIPKRKHGRVQRGIQQLLENKALFSYSSWLETKQIPPSPAPLQEAQRCADLILTYFKHAR